MRFKATSLDWALVHILKYGDTDIFPKQFEFAAIHSLWKASKGVREWMLKQDPIDWRCRPLRRCLVPKHRYGFRASSQLDPLDSIAYLSLVRDLGSDIEKKRIPTSREIVHSYRFKPEADGQLFDPAWGWNTFRKRSHELAKDEGCTHVVLADIADFFPRLYSHPLENELVACTLRRKSTAKAILGFLKQWNQTKSYGIPVGPPASRLLSELALTIIDNALLDESAIFCRFSDDYRIFCRSFREAHERLAFLAHNLLENLGLTLQQHKTKIVSVKEFRKFLVSPRKQELSRLSRQFEQLIDTLGLQDPYKKIEYDHLSPEKKKEVDALNLGEILEQQIELGEDIDIALASFVLRRLGQLREIEHIDLVVASLDILYPVFQDAVSFIALAGERLHGNKRKAIGGKLIAALEETMSGHLEFHRCCLINVFASSDTWDNESLLAGLESKWSDVFTRREAILARGRANHQNWFKAQKHDLSNFGPWERRAFLYAASCLPGDEPSHWWDGMKRQNALDTLDRAIVAYAKSKPIRKN